MCNFCPHKSTHMTEAQKHFKESHPDENIVNNKEICTVLRYYAKAEKWVEKCIQIQQEGILQHERNLIKQEDANSSTETLILEMDEQTPEKPELTPQHRRSSRVSIKPNLNQQNDSFEGDEGDTANADADELLPPVLEPEIPDMKEVKTPGLKCDHCNFVAKAQSNLNKHLKKHFEVKPFKCGLCKYTGSQLAHLQSHFYFKHTSEPLQYTMDDVPAEPQCRPLKRKRATSESSGKPVKIPATSEPTPRRDVVKTEPQPSNESIPAPDLLKVKLETNTTNETSNNYYLCYHCPRRSLTLDLIRSHFLEAHEKTHKNKFKYKKVTIDKPKKAKYSCRYCGWVGAPDSLRQHHLLKHLDQDYLGEKDVQLKCLRCPQVFSKMGPLKNHFIRTHPDQNLLYQSVTKENDEEFIETVDVIEEVLLVKAERPSPDINCAYCVLSFRDMTALRAHHDLVHSHLAFDETAEEAAKTRDELKKYKCPQCDHTSNSFAAMRDHLRNHNKPYMCGHCEVTASYPSVLKTHHLKEHRNLEPCVSIIAEAQKRNDELRNNLLHLQNGEYVRMDNLKRTNNDAAGPDEPPKKVLLMEEEQKRAKPKQRRKSIAAFIKQEVDPNDLLQGPVKQRKVNVARKSTATPPRIQNVAKKSTTPRPYVDLGFSYYGTKPLQFEEIKNIKSELPIMGKNVPLNIGSMSQILQLFPVVVVDDIGVKASNI